MKYSIIMFVALPLILFSCEQDKDLDNQYGILKGSVGIYEGNCMPGPGTSECDFSPLSTTVAITFPAEDFNMDLLVDSVISSANGSFEISLPAGEYSLFLRDTNKFVCDFWTCPDECSCVPFTISADSVTVVEASIDHAAW